MGNRHIWQAGVWHCSDCSLFPSQRGKREEGLLEFPGEGGKVHKQEGEANQTVQAPAVSVLVSAKDGFVEPQKEVAGQRTVGRGITALPLRLSTFQFRDHTGTVQYITFCLLRSILGPGTSQMQSPSSRFS